MGNTILQRHKPGRVANVSALFNGTESSGMTYGWDWVDTLVSVVGLGLGLPVVWRAVRTWRVR